MLGSPVTHSLSPVLHRAAYQALGLSGWSYEAVECGQDELAGWVAGLDEGWVGLSLTMPLKRVALDVAADVSPLAAAVGAANTLVRRPDGGWYADNTDVGGMVDALRGAGVTDGSGAVVLGAGGTAQAALAALRELGEVNPTVLVRDPTRTGELHETAQRLGMTVAVGRGMDDPAVYESPLVISTVPKGAADVVAHRPDWNLSGVTGAAGVVFDVVYDPWPTPLARTAIESGRRVVSGLELLLHQAVHQVRLMTGRSEVPVEAMRAALTEAVAAR